MSSFVASRPSSPGMRTSMITTFGLRRSARSIAALPSPASPTTRMCGARERERRSPSRTTSWSSTIRHVISLGTESIVSLRPVALHRECQLLWLRGRLEPNVPAVANTLLAGEPRHFAPWGLGVRLAEIRAAVGVELLVPRQLLGPVTRQVFEEVLARSGPQVEQVRPDPGGARGARGSHDLGELLGPVGEPGKDRRHANAGVDPRVDELAERAQTLAWMRGRRLGVPPD